MNNKHITGSNTPGRQVLNLRGFLAATALVGAGLLMASISQAVAAPKPETIPARIQTLIQAGKLKEVQFPNGALKLAGHLYLPPAFDAAKKYPTIISVHPGGGVKEQTAGLYAQKLAEQGFVTLAFDASHQGASEGMPRFLDDPMKRVGDIYSAVDYVTTLTFVDANRIGALGVCAGSGATVKASMSERRIKSLATVSAVDTGAAGLKGWDGTGSANPAAQIAALETVAKARSAQAGGAAPVYGGYVPAVGDKTAPRDLQEAADYYLTPRGQHPNAPNKRLIISDGYAALFSAFAGAETLLTQPLMVVAGSEAGSLWHSQELHAKAAGPKQLEIIPGATHMDLYDGQGADLAVSKLVSFFKRSL